ncbi:hypothetical protein [Mangrovicella endophytica]|uniref:hypothetical protein n=1 Tax=Mangrovicella endophytica TaxID=2066697 RepID=UPI000C9E41FF|nr:hypothetical protein [Mangrovicella endophytica]
MIRTATIAAVSALTLGFAGCTTVERDTGTGALIGGVGGAAIGAGVGGTKGAVVGGLIGAGAGAVAGNVIGRSKTAGDCVYRDRSGRRYVAECPSGY